MSYILCASPRTGSTLLCTLLAATGVAGNPNSFFRAQSLRDYAEDWDVPLPTDAASSRAYLNAALKEGTGGTGQFGLRLMHENLADLCAMLDTLYPGLPDDPARLAAAFNAPRYLHLSRSDKVAQAVSYEIARQSGLWHRNPDGTEMERVAPPRTPVYDAAQIRLHVEAFEEQTRQWTDWLQAHRITPLELTYEDLAANPQAVLARVMNHLGQNPDRAATIAPGVAKLADTTNIDWTLRYRADCGN